MAPIVMTAAVLSSAVRPLSLLLAAHPDIRRLIVGYSGGLDSHVLLHLLATHRESWPERTLEAVYVDHGLQAASTAWGTHCAQVCHDLGVSFRMLKIDARPASGESPEAAARRARYAALAAELRPDAALLTAHHCDDQAETLLLQLLRGAGPHGLAAMPGPPLAAIWPVPPNCAPKPPPGWTWKPMPTWLASPPIGLKVCIFRRCAN